MFYFLSSPHDANSLMEALVFSPAIPPTDVFPDNMATTGLRPFAFIEGCVAGNSPLLLRGEAPEKVHGGCEFGCVQKRCSTGWRCGSEWKKVDWRRSSRSVLLSLRSKPGQRYENDFFFTNQDK